MLRVFAKFAWFAWTVRGVLVQQKTPRAMRQARGARRAGALSGRCSASADALAKYENSGAHGIDPPPGAHRLSSGWDGSLIM
ncbi:hypothetical protein CP972_25035 [Streptomyces prasinus]|uniref:Secreted protein n=1 Tax=Streptomyces prasinus TaxID=67345 RepID=A0ABX6B2B2_9ACTN|nr:hypothetical protein CP972_25035 [Streptomyces prasinus]